VDAGPWIGVGIVVAVIGGLELIDRTSFALISLAARGPSLPTWLGGAAAFVVATGVAVTVGAALVGALGPGRIGLVRIAGGLFLLAYALWLYLHGGEEERPAVRDHRSAFAVAFLTILVLEMADTTMIFEIVFVTTFGALVVFVGGALALAAVAAWDVRIGHHLGRRIDARKLDRIVVVVLTVVGALTILSGVVPGAFSFLPG
jgi:putative Ca2+/H+ antiporter (TMEM165/GDT1 family)